MVCGLKIHLADTIIINADQIIDKYLINSSITILDNKFEIKKILLLKKLILKIRTGYLKKL